MMEEIWVIKGIIFDFDGLIFDTETPQYEVLQEIFLQHSGNLPLKRWQEEIGTHSGFSPFDFLEQQIGKELNHDVLNKEFEHKYHHKLKSTRARDGVVDFLKAAKNLQLKVGLASSSSYEWVARHLRNLDLYNYFECIKTRDDVKRVKPDPELYLKAAACLGLDYKECLVFEDSANGAIAAKKACMSCVIVPNEITKDLEFCQVEHRIDSMGHTTLEEIISIVNNALLTQ